MKIFRNILCISIVIFITCIMTILVTISTFITIFFYCIMIIVVTISTTIAIVITTIILTKT